MSAYEQCYEQSCACYPTLCTEEGQASGASNLQMQKQQTGSSCTLPTCSGTPTLQAAAHSSGFCSSRPSVARTRSACAVSALWRPRIRASCCACTPAP